LDLPSLTDDNGPDTDGVDVHLQVVFLHTKVTSMRHAMYSRKCVRQRLISVTFGSTSLISMSNRSSMLPPFRWWAGHSFCF